MIIESCRTQVPENLNIIVDGRLDWMQTSREYIDRLVADILNNEVHDDNVVVEFLTTQEQIDRMVNELLGISSSATEDF